MTRYTAVLTRNLQGCKSRLHIKIDLNFKEKPGRPVSNGLETHYRGWKVVGYYRTKKDKTR